MLKKKVEKFRKKKSFLPNFRLSKPEKKKEKKKKGNREIAGKINKSKIFIGNQIIIQ